MGRLKKNSHLALNIYIAFIFSILYACTPPKTFTRSTFKKNVILNGSIHKETLMTSKEFPWMKEGYSMYKPDSQITRHIKPYSDSVYVLIFAGTWCSDTQQELPRFFKVMDDAGFPPSFYSMFMVDMKKKCQLINPSVFAIRYVPTFIFYKNGMECGRIVEHPDSTLEQSILSIINSK